MRAVILPNNAIAYVSYENLILKYNIEKEIDKFCYKLKLNDENNISPLNMVVSLKTLTVDEIISLKKSSYEVYIDKEKIEGDLVIRNRVDGDVFSPIGLKGSKKLKEYFIDEKIPREERDSIPLMQMKMKLFG